MKQEAPDPTELYDLVEKLQYKDRWQITLENVIREQGSNGLTLCILISTPDAYHPQEMRQVMHYLIVPAATYNMRSWRRWLFDQILLVETHEAMEFFQVDGERPFAPSHGPGNDPYMIREIGTDEDQRTSYKGVLKKNNDVKRANL